MSSDVLAVVEASQPRRVMGAGMLAAVGALLLYVAMSGTPAPAALLFLLAAGSGALWMAVRLWQATTGRVELTEEVLRTGSGEVIARVADIESVDRGFFSLKPSNGFVLRLKVRARAGGSRGSGGGWAAGWVSAASPPACRARAWRIWWQA